MVKLRLLSLLLRASKHFFLKRPSTRGKEVCASICDGCCSSQPGWTGTPLSEGSGSSRMESFLSHLEVFPGSSPSDLGNMVKYGQIPFRAPCMFSGHTSGTNSLSLILPTWLASHLFWEHYRCAILRLLARKLPRAPHERGCTPGRFAPVLQ
jgi:hypothetical protein